MDRVAKAEARVIVTRSKDAAEYRLLSPLTTFLSSVAMMETLPYSALAPLLPSFKADLRLSTAQAGVLVAMYSVGLCGLPPVQIKVSSKPGEVQTTSSGGPPSMRTRTSPVSGTSTAAYV